MYLFRPNSLDIWLRSGPTLCIQLSIREHHFLWLKKKKIRPTLPTSFVLPRRPPPPCLGRASNPTLTRAGAPCGHAWGWGRLLKSPQSTKINDKLAMQNCRWADLRLLTHVASPHWNLADLYLSPIRSISVFLFVWLVVDYWWWFGPCLDVRKFYLFNLSQTVARFVYLW
jgi:hypothetical protein